MSKQLEKANLEQFQNEQLHELSSVSGGGITHTTPKRSMETANDKDSAPETTTSSES